MQSSHLATDKNNITIIDIYWSLNEFISRISPGNIRICFK